MKARARFVRPAWTLSVLKQCELLSVPRGQLYYTPKEERPENLQIMRIMDEHLGTITIDSTPEAGTSLTLTLPPTGAA